MSPAAASTSMHSPGSKGVLQVEGTLVATELEERPRGGVVYVKVPVGLKELCCGGVLSRRFARRRFQEDGTLAEEVVVMDLVVKPGYTNGTKLVFRGEGDESHSFTAGDIVFVLRETRHPTLQRVAPGSPHLAFKPLLCPRTEQYILQTALPDGSVVPLVMIPGVTNYITLENKGMPVMKKGELLGYGDLIITPQWK